MRIKSSVFFLITILFFTAQIFGQDGHLDYNDYNEFDIEGGYEPGTIIVMRNKRPKKLLITADRLRSVMREKSWLNYSDQTSIPSRSFDRTKIFSAGIDSKYSDIPVEVKTGLNRVKNVSVEVEDGVHYHLSGSIALIDVIYDLQQEDLEKISLELKNRSSVYLITDVLKYNSGSVKFQWDKSLNQELRTEIRSALKIAGDASWDNEGNLSIDYNEGVLVGFKAVKITSKYRRTIRERILALEGNPVNRTSKFSVTFYTEHKETALADSKVGVEIFGSNGEKTIHGWMEEEGGIKFPTERTRTFQVKDKYIESISKILIKIHPQASKSVNNVESIYITKVEIVDEHTDKVYVFDIPENKRLVGESGSDGNDELELCYLVPCEKTED